MYVISMNANGIWFYLYQLPPELACEYRYGNSLNLFNAKTFETIGEAVTFYENAVQRNLIEPWPTGSNASRLAIRKVICKEVRLLDSDDEENKEG